MEILGLVNLFFAIVIGLYFWNLLRQQQGSKTAVDRESRREMDKLRRLKSIALTEPLSELTRPKALQEIIGQSDGLKALRAALCGANPQHVIIYGPPGVGKTAAARVVLEEAKKNPFHPLPTMLPLWKWMPPPPVLTKGALLIPCWVLCMIPSIKVRGPWAWQGFLSPNQAR